MKKFLLIFFIILSAKASVLKRPVFVRDENHPAPLLKLMPRQAQEEKIHHPRSIKKKEKILQKWESKP
jgi:hypothetical protein